MIEDFLNSIRTSLCLNTSLDYLLLGIFMLGMQEIILILVILLVVFGPSKLPKLARELGKAWQEFNKASSTAFEALSSEDNIKNEAEKKLLLEVATKLDVNSKGKTDQQLTDEILAKIINRKVT